MREGEDGLPRLPAAGAGEGVSLQPVPPAPPTPHRRPETAAGWKLADRQVQTRVPEPPDETQEGGKVQKPGRVTPSKLSPRALLRARSSSSPPLLHFLDCPPPQSCLLTLTGVSVFPPRARPSWAVAVAPASDGPSTSSPSGGKPSPRRHFKPAPGLRNGRPSRAHQNPNDTSTFTHL